MKILVVNCGSSSIKYQFIESDTQEVLTKGVVERIGMSGAILSNHRADGDSIKITGEILDHGMAIEYVLAVLLSKNHGVIADKSEIDAVAFLIINPISCILERLVVSTTSAKQKILSDDIDNGFVIFKQLSEALKSRLM